jgi:hypothetical protein
MPNKNLNKDVSRGFFFMALGLLGFLRMIGRNLSLGFSASFNEDLLFTNSTAPPGRHLFHFAFSLPEPNPAQALNCNVSNTAWNTWNRPATIGPFYQFEAGSCDLSPLFSAKRRIFCIENHM